VRAGQHLRQRSLHLTIAIADEEDSFVVER